MLETDAHTDFVEITFAAGLPGFPHVHVFQLKPWGPPGSPYLLLTSVEESDVGFVVVAGGGLLGGHGGALLGPMAVSSETDGA